MNEKNVITSAFDLHLTGALTDAEIAYRRILSVDPLQTEVQHHLGVLLHQKGNTQEGIELIIKALEIDAGSASRYNDLGNIFTQIGGLTDAAAAFSLSLDFNDTDANVWTNFGSVLHRQQHFADAENAYRVALYYNIQFIPALNNLATLLAEQGQEEESSWYECLAYIQPPLTGKSPIMLGTAYYRLNFIADAAEYYRMWLKKDANNAFATHHLAACTGEEVPSKASDCYLRTIFDGTAEHFEENLVGKLLYQGPEIIIGLLERHLLKSRVLDVLDGGCGTGLCGSVLTQYAKHLTGVDISPGMLAKAKKKALYNNLVEMELATYLTEQQQAFDLICMADTLIYFGDLSVFFGLVRRALRLGGKFVFTVEVEKETTQEVGFTLAASGRYTHSYRYLTQLLVTHHFSILRIEEVILRMEIGQPTQGFGVLAEALPL